MEAILQAVQDYFQYPLETCACHYPAARLVEVRDGTPQYSSPDTQQPLEAAWDLLLLDQISPQLCYVHVGYSRGPGYCHEILTFLRLGSGWKLVSILRAAASARYSSACSDPCQEQEILQAIAQTLLTYCNAVYNLDAEQALSVFTEEAHMLHPVDEDRFADVSCGVFRERWAGLQAPEVLGLPQYTHIYHIELLSRDTAVAKVGVAKLNDHFNDYLFCVNTADGWRIAHKLTQSLWLNPEYV